MTNQPGWRADPDGAPMLRFHDGYEWTAHTAPLPPPGQQSPAPQSDGRITIHYGFAVVAVFSLMVTLLFGIPAFTSEDGSGIGVGLGVFWVIWGGMWTLIWTAFAIHHTIRSKR
ncbi:DUF2510 domain-containing protein [Mycobacterium sp. SVM_VP21]|nr:DUF2510 domain-containing protein [Mycobacterium sp. SVM_VP21]